MTIRRKLTASCLAALMSLGLLTACGDPAPDEPTGTSMTDETMADEMTDETMVDEMTDTTGG